MATISPLFQKVHQGWKKPGPSHDLIIFDATGRIVYRDEITGMHVVDHVKTVDVSGLPEGMYHCQLFINGRPGTTENLIIVR
jgi:hypothetical protein